MTDYYGPGTIVVEHPELGEARTLNLSGEMRLDGLLDLGWEIVES